MGIVGLIGSYILYGYSILLWARFVLEWIRQVAPQWRPRGLTLFLAETTFTLTDPPIKFVRRFVKPVRLGVVAIDFSWTIVLVVVYILMGWLSK